MRTDKAIKEDVREDIVSDPKIANARTGDPEKDGATALHGTVRRSFQKQIVIKPAKRVHAIEEIKIKSLPGASVEDQDSATRTAYLSKGHTPIRMFDLKGEEKNGHALVADLINFRSQNSGIHGCCVSNLPSVTNAPNSIAIKPSGSKIAIRKMVSTGLHRSADLETPETKCQVTDGNVRSQGYVLRRNAGKLANAAVRSGPEKSVGAQIRTFQQGKSMPFAGQRSSRSLGSKRLACTLINAPVHKCATLLPPLFSSTRHLRPAALQGQLPRQETAGTRAEGCYRGRGRRRAQPPGNTS